MLCFVWRERAMATVQNPTVQATSFPGSSLLFEETKNKREEPGNEVAVQVL